MLTNCTTAGPNYGIQKWNPQNTPTLGGATEGLCTFLDGAYKALNLVGLVSILNPQVSQPAQLLAEVPKFIRNMYCYDMSATQALTGDSDAGLASLGLKAVQLALLTRSTADAFRIADAKSAQLLTDVLSSRKTDSFTTSARESLTTKGLLQYETADIVKVDKQAEKGWVLLNSLKTPGVTDGKVESLRLPTIVEEKAVEAQKALRDLYYNKLEYPYTLAMKVVAAVSSALSFEEEARVMAGHDEFTFRELRNANREFNSTRVDELLQTLRLYNLQSTEACNPLFRVVTEKDDRLLKELSSRDDVEFNPVDENGNTPVHFAVRGGQRNILKILTESNGIHLSRINNDGETPLSLAVNMKRARDGHQPCS